MISKRILQEELGLKSIEDYFDVIFDNYIANETEKCMEMYLEMSIIDRIRCIKYFDGYAELIQIFNNAQGKRTLRIRKRKKK